MYKTILFVLISFSTMLAQTAGNSGLSFLKMGFGARNIAMGDAGTAISNDVSSLFYNPANLSISNNSQIMIMHNQGIQGIKSELLGVRSSIWGIPFAVGFNVTSIDNIEVRNRPGAAIASFNAHYFFGSLSTGFHVAQNVAVGITAKYLYEGLYTDQATGWGFDLGTTYQTPLKGLYAAAVIKNLGSMNKLKNDKTKLPTEFRVGPAYKFDFSDSKFAVTTTAELQKYTATTDVHVNVGAEVVYDKLIALRGGYQSGYQAKSFTGGFGLMWGNLEFDYAFQPFSLGLGSANMFSLQFKF